MMEKRTLIAIALSIAVLLIWQFLVLGPQEARRQAAQQERQARLEQEKLQAPAAEPKTEEPPPQAAAAEQARGNAALRPPAAEAVPEETIRVATPLMDVLLSNRGGAVKQITLKGYKADNGTPLVLAMPEPGGEFPLFLHTNVPDINKALNGSTYAVRGGDLALDDRRPEGTLTFTLDQANGLRVEKRLTFHQNRYQIDVGVRVEGGALKGQGYEILWGPGLNAAAANDDEPKHGEPAVFLDGKLSSPQPAGAAWQERQGKALWAGIQSKYFVAAMIPRSPVSAVVVRPAGEKRYSAGFEIDGRDLGVAKEFTLYAGPKELQRLRAYDVKLERVVDFGYFGFLGRPLQRVLAFFYRYSHNYGLAIIIITVLIKLAFYPLTNKSLASMKKMQSLQPRIKELQERYKGDRQKINQEMMGIYRQQGASPISGCLPMALQIPVFIALYNVLLTDISLRHAPFLLWITDLSKKDPYYITPIIMGASMFLQQKMTPTTIDPTQAKMMLMMPVVFTFMFLNFPSGLVIYWLVNNILSIGQQLLVNRKLQESAPTT
ncbi:MAG: membrane protein insertase YidC [Candidatus Tectomicrobia bacterium]|nr:membrane protein insertase YidC [Candidatus Tectomicrobia bacterium]